jgi:hypothetical protein
MGNQKRFVKIRMKNINDPQKIPAPAIQVMSRAL